MRPLEPVATIDGDGCRCGGYSVFVWAEVNAAALNDFIEKLPHDHIISPGLAAS